MDWVYLLYGLSGFFILVAVIISVVAQTKVYNRFNEYSKVKSSLNITGRQLAEELALKNGLKLNVR